MQILSLAGTGLLAQALPLSNVPASQQALHDFMDRLMGDWKQLGLYLVATQVVAIISYWLASKPLAEDEEGTLGRAFKVWGLYLLFTIAAALVTGVVMSKYILPALPAQGGQVPRDVMVAELILCGMGLVLFIAVFAVPIRVYRFGLGSSILYVILAWVLMVAGGLGLWFAFSKPLARLNDNAQELLVRLGKAGDPVQSSIFRAKAEFERATEASERRATDRSRSIADRQQAVKDYYAQLEAYRATLNSSNPVGIAEYERRKDRYEKILANLRAEAAGETNPPR
jgi:hypothetical protein